MVRVNSHLKEIHIAQSNLSWHMAEPLGISDNFLRIECLLLRSNVISVIIIVFRTSPLSKIYSVNSISFKNPSNPFKWIEVR